jgi:hypothetical protein
MPRLTHLALATARAVALLPQFLAAALAHLELRASRGAIRIAADHFAAFAALATVRIGADRVSAAGDDTGSDGCDAGSDGDDDEDRESARRSARTVPAVEPQPGCNLKLRHLRLESADYDVATAPTTTARNLRRLGRLATFAAVEHVALPGAARFVAPLAGGFRDTAAFPALRRLALPSRFALPPTAIHASLFPAVLAARSRAGGPLVSVSCL